MAPEAEGSNPSTHPIQYGTQAQRPVLLAMCVWFIRMVALALCDFLYQYPVVGVNRFSSQVSRNPMIFISEEANQGHAAALLC